MAVSLLNRIRKQRANESPFARQRRVRSRRRFVGVLLFCVGLHILAVLFLGERLVLPPSPVRQELSVTLLAPPEPAQPPPQKEFIPKPAAPKSVAPKPVAPKPAVPKPRPRPVPATPAATASTAPADVTNNATSFQTATATPPAPRAAEVPVARPADPTIHDYPVALPEPVSLDYAITALSKGSTYHGSGNITFRTDQQPGRYRPARYSIDGKAGVLFFNAFVFHSEGMAEHGNLVPALYAEKRFGRAPTHTYFNQKTNKITFSDSGNTYPIEGSEQDRSSMIWQIVGMARANPGAIAPGQVIQFFIAGTKDAQIWKINAGAQETLTLDGKQIITTRLTRIPKPGDHDQTIDFWLARDHGWLPVRLLYTETNGDYLDMQVKRIDLLEDSSVTPDPYAAVPGNAPTSRPASDDTHDGA